MALNAARSASRLTTRAFARSNLRVVATGFAGVATVRTMSSTIPARFWTPARVALATAATGTAMSFSSVAHAKSATIDWQQVRKEIIAVLDNPNYDDGSYGPVLVRLAWHAAGTYDKTSKTGGSNGGRIRHSPEADWGANAGLGVARNLLEPIKKRHPEISYADLYTFAGVVAIEEMGGPKIPWRPGRTDESDGKNSPPDGRLPDASKDQSHIRQVFYRMGFNDREIVALSGAHSLGRCHTDRSGFNGPWTRIPTGFTNEYFRELLENTWTVKKWNGPLQYEDPTGELMMLETDLALVRDPEFKKWVEHYSKDQDAFFKDFATAFGKLLELGVPFPSYPS